MAFVLDLEPTYSWPVSVAVPIDGCFRKFSFEAIFHRLPQSRVEEITVARVRAKEAIESGAADALEQLAVCRGHALEILAGWKGVKAKDGDAEDLPFTDTNAKRFLEVSGMAIQIITAYGESLGIGKEKN